MPTYEYRCPDGHTFDRFMKMSEAAAELPCPECGAVATRQLSGGAGLLFKGSGFYLTDYGRNAHRTSGPSSSTSATSGGESKSSSGGDKSGGKGSSGSSGSSGGSGPATGGPK